MRRLLLVIGVAAVLGAGAPGAAIASGVALPVPANLEPSAAAAAASPIYPVPAPAAAPASAPPLPACRYTDVQTRYDAFSQWRKTLLDTIEKVGKRYAPPDLVSVSRASIPGSGRVRSLVINALADMARAARKAGAGIAVRSAYRSYAQQKAVFASWVQRQGLKKALLGSARPGHSEHQLGTTIDFQSAGSSTAPWDVKDWATTRAGAWMKANAWKYGFVMSYPKGQRATSCYQYEPWHYRYVGRAEAKAVHDSGMVLRRYLWETYETAPGA